MYFPRLRLEASGMSAVYETPARCPVSQEEAARRFTAWLAEHAMPDTAESYQRDQIAEHAGRTIHGQR